MTRLRTFAIACLGLACWPALAAADATIRTPNAHLHYGAEVDAHLVVQWDDEPAWHDEGLGLGVHVGIPVIDNGPVSSINNSLAITVGLDWAHFGDDCTLPGLEPERGCAANDFWLPITAQWNFYFSDAISAFPELGLAIQHTRWDDGFCRRNGAYVRCEESGSHTSVRPVLWLGVRWQLQDTFALTLRVGSPSLLLGVSFLL